ncbi:SHOCT domain-containing protein [Halorussus halophilus]|uniref:SHOCT domain-containing protein n=1 Tax=Halorussus halophilus TaxID=2650975 RepID=UPI001787F49B|nr:DUF4429 domain-containing protein [Halorussus halophilus]
MFGSSDDEEEASNSDLVHEAKGANGQVELKQSKIIIKRKGMLAKLGHMGKGNKEIPISSITSIQFKDAGRVTNGYIQFGQSGYSESDGGAFDAANDENSVMFKRKQQEEFETLKEEIDDIRENGGDSGGRDTDPAIDALREKFATGEISKEEYEERLAVLEA